MYRVAFFAILATASASIYKDSHCPVVKGVENFNMSSYGEGIWYEVGRYPNAAESGGNCGFSDNTLVGNVIKVKHGHVENNKLEIIEGTAVPAPDANGSGKLIYTLPYGACGQDVKSILYVLSTDYENYAILYYCNYNEKKNSRQDFAWIISRDKFLSPHMKSKIDKNISNCKVLDHSKFMYPDFSDGACYIDSIRS